MDIKIWVKITDNLQVTGITVPFFRKSITKFPHSTANTMMFLQHFKKKSVIFAAGGRRHTVSMELEKKHVGICFLWTDHSFNGEVCWRLSSTNWAANPFLEIPHEWTCAKLRSTPPRQDTSSLKHISLFGWKSPSPTRFTSNYRIPT